MTTDIFEFWSKIGRGQRIHPEDKRVFDRMDPERHGFQLDCLPGCFSGPLKTAKVVLLYLSPGYEDGEEKQADDEETKDRYARRWTGNDELHSHHWFMKRTRRFGDFNILKREMAILNIGAYHSKDVQSYASMLALPSSRVTLDWAQNVLFDEAEKQKRIVICMRSAAYWGLETGKKYNGDLYAPMTVRSGHLLKSPENTELEERVCAKLGTEPDWS